MANYIWDSARAMGATGRSVKMEAPFTAYIQRLELIDNRGATPANGTREGSRRALEGHGGLRPDPPPAVAWLTSRRRPGTRARSDTRTSPRELTGRLGVTLGAIAGKAGWNLAPVKQVGVKYRLGRRDASRGGRRFRSPTPATIYVAERLGRVARPSRGWARVEVAGARRARFSGGYPGFVRRVPVVYHFGECGKGRRGILVGSVLLRPPFACFRPQRCC